MTKKEEREFLERMAEPPLIDHDPNICGHCKTSDIWARVARRLLKLKKLPPHAIRVWSKVSRKTWEHSKFYRLWQQEKEAGRDPQKAFEERGWEP